MSNEYIIINGILKKKDDLIFSADNRSFLYGDGFFETILGFNNSLPFLNYHINRIKKALEVFDFIKIDLLADIEQLKTAIVYLARKNKLYKYFRTRLTIYRNSGGFYTPNDNTVSFIIQTFDLEIEHFKLNEQGLKIGLFKDARKDFSIFSPFKTNNSLIYILASKYAFINQLDDVIILNTYNNIVETKNSNIFFIKDGVISTPSVEQGCISGIMRQVIIDVCNQEGIEIIQKDLPFETIHSCDEIFITNSINPIRYISMFENKRYVNFTIKHIFEILRKKFQVFSY